MNFKQMMAKRKETILKNAKEFVTGGFKKDERFWELTTDKTGNGSAVIRFLPQKDFNINPLVTRLRHSFKRKGKQFWALCPKTLGWDEECPVCDELDPLYDDYVDTSKGKKFTQQEQIDLIKRRKEHIINILVVDDPSNPDNNGKIFLFKMNGILHEMYTKAINPPTEMITPVIVYDYYVGANFQYICIGPQKKGEFNDYKSSRFLETSSLAEDTMEEIWNNTYDLAEFTDPKLFKSFTDIEKDFRKIYFNETVAKEIPGANTVAEEVDDPFDTDEEPTKTDNNDFSFDDKASPESNLSDDANTSKTTDDDGFVF